MLFKCNEYIWIQTKITTNMFFAPTPNPQIVRLITIKYNKMMDHTNTQVIGCINQKLLTGWFGSFYI